MAKCGHCNAVGTKIELIAPSGGNYKLAAVACVGCGAILGVTDFYNVGTLVKQQETKIARLTMQVDELLAKIRQLSNHR